MKTQAVLFGILILLIEGCVPTLQESQDALTPHQGPIRIAGAYALYPLVGIWVEEYQKIHPDTEFEVVAMGSGAGLNELVEGHTDLAMISGNISPEWDSLLWITPVARLGVVLITSSRNPYLTQIRSKGLTRGQLALAFTDRSGQFWGQWFGEAREDQVHLYMRSDSAGATDQLAKFLWHTPSEILGTGVYGEEAMVDVVMNDPLSLGYCNFIYTFDPHSQCFKEGICIVPLNPEHKGRGVDPFYDSVPQLQRAMWSGKYPSSLIRNLYLACKGIPSTIEMVEFLKWILQDGQRLVAREGYIEVPSNLTRCSLESLHK